MTEPPVSIVIPVFMPHAVFFRQAIESVLNQSFTDFERIVVEDPSPSSGRAMLAGVDDPRSRDGIWLMKCVPTGGWST